MEMRFVKNVIERKVIKKKKPLTQQEWIAKQQAEMKKNNFKIFIISIKGKTSESIGFIGRQEGIAAMVSTAIQVKDINIK